MRETHTIRHATHWCAPV